MQDDSGASVLQDARKKLCCVDVVLFTELCNPWNSCGAPEGYLVATQSQVRVVKDLNQGKQVGGQPNSRGRSQMRSIGVTISQTVSTYAAHLLEEGAQEVVGSILGRI